MNNYIVQRFFNLLIVIILISQVGIIYFNSKVSFEKIQKINISVENFSSFALSRYGITSFGSEKLNRLDEYNIFLEGSSYLENDTYRVYGKNISINTKSEVSTSEMPVEVVNSMGTINANGFKNIGIEGKIYFLGDSKFTFHE